MILIVSIHLYKIQEDKVTIKFENEILDLYI